MSILGFFKRREAWKSHPLVDQEGRIFLFVFRDKHSFLDEEESACLIGSVTQDRDALVRQKGSVLAITKHFCQSARYHNAQVLANWVRSGDLQAGASFRDPSFLETMRTQGLGRETEPIETLGFVPYILAFGPISERYAAMLAQKLAQRFPKYLGFMFFPANTVMKTIAVAMGCGGGLQLEL